MNEQEPSKDSLGTEGANDHISVQMDASSHLGNSKAQKD